MRSFSTALTSQGYLVHYNSFYGCCCAAIYIFFVKFLRSIYTPRYNRHKMNFNSGIIVVAMIMIIYYLYNFAYIGKEPVVANDGMQYYVVSGYENQKGAADMLSYINKNVMLFLKYLKIKYRVNYTEGSEMYAREELLSIVKEFNSENCNSPTYGVNSGYAQQVAGNIKYSIDTGISYAKNAAMNVLMLGGNTLSIVGDIARPNSFSANKSAGNIANAAVKQMSKAGDLLVSGDLFTKSAVQNFPNASEGFSLANILIISAAAKSADKTAAHSHYTRPSAHALQNNNSTSSRMEGFGAAVTEALLGSANSDSDMKMLGNAFSNSAVDRLLSGYDLENIMENDPTASGDNTYTVDKGARMVVCLRDRKTFKLHDKPIVMFVVLHELAHIANERWGHSSESQFWEIFKFLLHEAKACGMHEPVDYSKHPIVYCGLSVNYNPYFDPAIKNLW